MAMTHKDKFEADLTSGRCYARKMLAKRLVELLKQEYSDPRDVPAEIQQAAMSLIKSGVECPAEQVALGYLADKLLGYHL